MARTVAQSSAAIRPASAQALWAAGVSDWMGPMSLPLWIDDPLWRYFATLDTSRARAEGLLVRPLADTLAAALDYEESRGVPRQAGLTDDEERRLRHLLES